MKLNESTQTTPSMTSSVSAFISSPDDTKRFIQDSKSSLVHLLELAKLRMEKCELEESYETYASALEISLSLSRKHKDASLLRYSMEAIAGLLRLSAEAMDGEKMVKWGKELDELMEKFPKQVPPMAYYCKALVSAYQNQRKKAIRLFSQYLRSVQAEQDWSVGDSQALCLARGLVSLAIFWKNHRPLRSRFIAQMVLKRYESAELHSINGLIYLLLGNLEERVGKLEIAQKWFQKAHVSFLGEHNWYYHLYVLYGYARIHRLQQNYPQAYWFLDLAEKAAAGTPFLQLRKELAFERAQLEQDAVDLLIDSRKCQIQTRDGAPISLRKQYILLHILEALSKAHGRQGEDRERGLSKSEIIEQVWHENYRPEAHDNKLYYNINRLRKLIEPDVKKPQYLLNWKEGYRLAPGLKVQYLTGGNRMNQEEIQ